MLNSHLTRFPGLLISAGVVLTICGTFLTPVFAQQQMAAQPARVQTGTAEVAKQPLDWFAGHWCVDLGGETVEELWLPPHGGFMVGLGRTRSAEKTTGFEYFRITDIDGVQSYIAQPGGRPPTSFKRTDGGENWVRFENPEHDFPQRIEYRREGDVLHAEVGGPGDNGEEAVIGFDYIPCG